MFQVQEALCVDNAGPYNRNSLTPLRVWAPASMFSIYEIRSTFKAALPMTQPPPLTALGTLSDVFSPLI